MCSLARRSPNRLIPILFLIFSTFLIPSTRAGCYQQRLCCTGRNNTCKAVDDGIDHLPTISPRRPQFVRERPSVVSSISPYAQYHSPYYEASGEGYDLVYPEVFDEEHHSRIGKLVLPDVIELEGSGAAEIYGKYGPQQDDYNAPARLVQAAPSTTTSTSTTTSPAPKITHLIFGPRLGPDTAPEDQLRYLDDRPRHLLIRYSILSQHLPLTVTTTPSSEEEPELRIQYLEASPVDCFCDEDCVELGDCCSDYTFVCPPRDCEVSEWSSWEVCVPDQGKCGTGVQQRLRTVRQERERGGAKCPPLKEMRTCHHNCPTKEDDMTTVALLLDYRYNTSRSRSARNNVYWDLPEVVKKIEQATYYCVRYEIGWVNRNCRKKQLTKGLFRGNTICGECQPEAQLHRKNGRCASDLEDGDEGFWKLIGPQSCNGIWRRLERTDNCRCHDNWNGTTPFLLV